MRFRRSNYPNHYTGHCEYTLKIDPNTDGYQDLYLKDSTFKLTIPPISDEGNFLVLQSVNFSNYHVRHCGFRIRINPRQETQLYKDDALNERQGYISKLPREIYPTSNFELWLDSYDGAQLDKDDTSFEVFDLCPFAGSFNIFFSFDIIQGIQIATTIIIHRNIGITITKIIFAVFPKKIHPNLLILHFCERSASIPD